MPTLNYTNNNNNLFQNSSNFISSTVNNFIVRPFGNPNLTGVSGFLFDIIEDEEVVIESIITDNFIEDNTTVQDHIALKPLRFTLRGYVGELVDEYTNTLASIFIAAQAFPFVSTFAPSFTAQASQAYSAINNVQQSANNVLNQAKSLYSLFSGSATNASKQQNGYQYFYDLWSKKTLVSVETPFGKFDDMAIESVRVLQPANFKDISDFTVTFKKIRKVKSIVVASVIDQQATGTSSTAANVVGGNLSGYIASPINKGNVQGNAQSVTTLANNFK